MNDLELKELFSEVDDRFLEQIAKFGKGKSSSKSKVKDEDEDYEDEDLTDFLKKDVHDGDIDEMLISHLEDQGD